ncbi:MAG: hypothetical protein P8O05_09885 [Flavobacteriales bacterium]|nr:hypothetical protein [Flavobacteriales bacterium]
MRIAIIDCGTNTFNLLLSERRDAGWHTLFSAKVAVKLGKGGMSKGIITEERIARAVDALNTHYNTILNFNVKHVRIYATSAIRDASNGHELVAIAKKKFDFTIQVIDGDQEAELIFNGVKQTVDLTEENVLVMDIGGGSTEFIIGNKNSIQWKLSLPLGVARIFEFLSPSDPMTMDENEKLNQFFATNLSQVAAALKKHPCNTLIGSSGSFDTLFELNSQQQEAPIQRFTSNDIPLDVFAQLQAQLLASTKSERLLMPGMLPLRVDYIALATALIDYMINTFQISKLIHSDYALKEGALQLAASELRSWNES